MDAIKIPCELTIIPGGGNGRQNRIELTVNGETAITGYESELREAGHLKTIQAVAAAHARLLSKWSQS